MNIKYNNILTKTLLETLYNECGSANKIGKQLNISAGTIIKYLDKFNIKRKENSIYAINDKFFATNTEASFYWAGFIAADGCINNNRLALDLSAKDKDHLSKINNILSPGKILREAIVKEKYKIYRYSIVSKQIISDLERFNIVPRKSLIYTFPKTLINHHLINHFMRGYFDGDGCFKQYYTKNTTQMKFNLLGTENFLLTYLDILKQCCKIKNDKKISKVRNIYSLDFGGNNIVGEISIFLYKDATIFLERKYDKIKHLL